MQNLFSAFKGIGGILAVQLTSLLEVTQPEGFIPDPENIELLGKLLIQLAIGIIAIWQILKKKKPVK